MNQLDLFRDKSQSKPKKRRVGRPNKLTPKLVFNVIKDIKSGKRNKKIIEKYKLNERTFFRIKSGFYNNLLKEAVEESSQYFSLELSE